MSRNRAIDFHNDIATQFDRKYESSAAFVERFRVWTNLFGRYVVPGDYVIDLGCGSGIFSNYLAEKGCQVIGIDGSAAMIGLANQKKTSDKVQYIRQTLPLVNPMPYGQQDVVIMSSLLEYLPDTKQMLWQVSNLLRPNGLFLVSMPNRLSLYRQIERILFQLTGYPAYFAHIRQRSTEVRFAQQLINSGFDVLQTVYFSSHDPVSRLLKPVLPRQYVNNLFVMVCRKVDK